jgi:hypothetical protein
MRLLFPFAAVMMIGSPVYAGTKGDGSHRAMRPGVVRLGARSVVEGQGRDGAGRHEVEIGIRMVRHIYSRDSGNIYYGMITTKGPNSLWVEACALGRFFCSGNIWSRGDIKPQRLISDRGISSEPRS